jgi:PAS domain S-box-containing protein
VDGTDLKAQLAVLAPRDSLRWLYRRTLLNYAGAVLAVVVASFIVRLMQVAYDFQPLLTPFLCAVMFSAWLGGLRPGLIAVALSVGIYYRFFLMPLYPAGTGMEKELPRLLLAASTGLFIMSLTAAQRSAAEKLRESEQRFRQIAENIREVFWVASPAMDEVLYASPAYENVWGRSRKDLRSLSQTFMQTIHVEDRRRVAAAMQRRPEFEVEYRVVRPDGTMRWVRDRGFPVRNEAGEIYRIAGVAEDITERKLAEEDALEVAQKVQAVAAQKEDHLRLVIDTIPAMAWSLLPSGIVDFVNQRWLEFTGLTPEEALAGATSIVHPDDLPGVVDTWLANKAEEVAYEDEMRLRRADGEYRWFLVRTSPLIDGQGRVVKWYGTSTDIEDRRRAENALRDAALQLQALSRRLVEVQEAERKELARELHDRVGQSLTALNINLAILRQGLSRHDIGIRLRLDDSAALVESSMQAIGNVLSDLRPQMLDDHGLRPALEWYAKQFAARAEIEVSVRASEPPERMAAEMEIALFRIAQEALNNVAKHARATSVEVALDCLESEHVMSVTDDGVGLGVFDAGSNKTRPGLGMATMRERAQVVGGKLQVESLPGRGTRVTVRIPKHPGPEVPEISDSAAATSKTDLRAARQQTRKHLA